MGKPLSHSVCVPPEVKKRWPIAVLTCFCLGLLLLVEAEFSVTEPFATSNCEVSCWIGTSLKQSPCALSEGIGCHTSTDLMNWKFLNETMHDTSIVSSVGTPPATISDVPVATCLVVVRVAAGPTVVPTADAPSTAVPQYSQCLMDAGSAPDAILTHPRPPLFTLSDGPPQPPNLPTPADSNPAAYYLQDDDDRISWAVANWEEETCIRFTKCSSPFTCEEPFMVFVSDASRCDAPVGTSGCVSEVNIRTIRYQGWVAHVTAHALGLSRENTRNDRDGYVTLNESNIWSKSERAADRCRAIADGAAFRRGRGEEDGFVEFHSEGHLQPVVHEAPVVVRARVAPRGAKLLEVAGSFSTNFAATISDVSVATCSVVARMAAGTTDAPPSAVPQTAAPAPCTCGNCSDVDGNFIHAHGGQMVEYNDVFYLNGTSLKQSPCALSEGIGCHTSTGLMNWEFLNETMLETSIISSVGTPPWRIERPKIVRWEWVPTFRPSTITSEAATSPSPHRPGSTPRHPVPTPPLSSIRSVLRCSVTRKQRRRLRKYDRQLAQKRAQRDGRAQHLELAAQLKELLSFALATSHCVVAPSSAQAAGPPFFSLESFLDVPQKEADNPPAPQPTATSPPTTPATLPTISPHQPTTRDTELTDVGTPRDSAHSGRHEFRGPKDTPYLPFAATPLSPVCISLPPAKATTCTAPPQGMQTVTPASTPLTTFFVTGVDGKRRCVSASLGARLSDVLIERGLIPGPGVRVIGGRGAPLSRDLSLGENGFEAGMSPSISILPSVLGGDPSRGRGRGSNGRPSEPSRQVGTSRGAGVQVVSHEVCDSRRRRRRGGGRGRKPLERDANDSSGPAPSAPRAAAPSSDDGLYPGWEAPEARFRVTILVHDLSWSEVQELKQALVRSHLHKSIDRQIINGIWDVSADRELAKHELYVSVRAAFAVPKDQGENVLRSSGFSTAFFEPLYDEAKYRILYLGVDTIDEAQELASLIPDLHRGLSFCRGTFGIRVKAGDYNRAKALLPPLPPPIGYFEVQGVPSRTNGDLLRRNLCDHGWETTPLFRTQKGGRHLTWIVKSETLPGKNVLLTAQGLTLKFKRILRCPLEPLETRGSPPLSDAFRAPAPAAPADNETPQLPSRADLIKQHGPALAEKILAGLHLLGDRSGPAPAGKPLAGGLTIAAVDHPEDESVMDVDVAVSAEEEEDAASDTPSEHPPPQPADPPCAQPDALAAAVSQVMALSEQLRSNYKDAVAKTETDLCSGFRSITEGMNAKFDNLAAEIRAQSVALANTRSELSADIQRRGTEAENSHRELSEAVKHQSVALELTRDKLTTFEHDRDRRSKRPSGRERGRSLDRGEAPSRTDADLTHQSMPSAGQTPPAQETVPIEVQPQLESQTTAPPTPPPVQQPVKPPPAQPRTARSALKTSKGPSTKDTAQRAARERSQQRALSARPPAVTKPSPEAQDAPMPQAESPQAAAAVAPAPIAPAPRAAGRGRGVESVRMAYPPPRSHSADLPRARGAGQPPTKGLLPSDALPGPEATPLPTGTALPELDFDGSPSDGSPPLLSQH
ncbi:Astacin [Diplonema papillatum]|nr:Astacin [Diplonema papillatum]